MTKREISSLVLLSLICIAPVFFGGGKEYEVVSRVFALLALFVASSKFEIGNTIQIQIAHGEGRFYCDDATLTEINKNNQVLFRYCDAEGNVTKESNPNGAIENIAGICNRNRNVFGMMPHPERASDSVLGNTDGKKIFDSIWNTVLA